MANKLGRTLRVHYGCTTTSIRRRGTVARWDRCRGDFSQTNRPDHHVDRTSTWTGGVGLTEVLAESVRSTSRSARPGYSEAGRNGNKKRPHCARGRTHMVSRPACGTSRSRPPTAGRTS
ncbi:hypothetical protein PSTG_19362, partial [Puccinia striiformis f. sp. tritici PST-78]